MPSRLHVNITATRFCALKPQPTLRFRAPAEPGPRPPPPSRWVSDVPARIGKCVMFGCDAAQVRRAAGVLGTFGEGLAWSQRWERGLPLGRARRSGGSTGRLGRDGQFCRGGIAYLYIVRETTRPGRHSLTSGRMCQGHVNNATYIRYAESARVNWILSFAARDPKHREAWNDLMKPKSIGLIMKSIKADYKFHVPDARLRHHLAQAPPRRGAHVRGRAIYDYREARKTTLPGFMLDVLQDTWRAQEARADEARERVWGLLREVEGLEKETWDREDAVEDLGAASKR
ncbi:hypothetical protein EKO27_g11432 [Xylaria grammica]|uniref:Uncharacterized protein n=1 Tax=Xylaria grammica TaxID=363999 RepID=A0A439CNL7_9PEZI|nr:hypothetical protein EKO27_g11432 [Xylaria grammica]